MLLGQGEDVTAAKGDVETLQRHTIRVIGGRWWHNLTSGFLCCAGSEFTRILCFIGKTWSQMYFVFVCSMFHHRAVIHSDILNLL